MKVNKKYSFEKKAIKIVFFQGGLSKEFFQLITEQIFGAEYGMLLI